MNELLEEFVKQYAPEAYEEPQGYFKSLFYRRRTNRSVYEKRLHVPHHPKFNYTPRYMYFYYVKIDSDGKLKVTHFYYVDGDRKDPRTWKEIPNDKGKLEEIVHDLAINAREATPNNPPPCDQINFEGIKWRRKSYIAIFFDEANWTFYEKGSGPGVLFLTRKKGKRMTDNHSFFDALDLDIEIVNENDPSIMDDCTGIAFINHMKRADGEDLEENENEPFQFNMFLNVKFLNGTGSPMDVIFDPGGTNTGPPLEP